FPLEPLAERHNRLNLRDHIPADGTVVTPLTELEIDKFITEFKTLEGIESLAICCLFSFLNPAHEQQIAAAVRRECPDIYVSVSSEVQPEFREYERFSTTLINAFLQPEVSRYMERLQAAISKTAAQAKFGIFQSSGGLMSIERAAKFPVRTALSGPAAGAVGAAAAAGLSGVWDVLTLDMGGTSTDVCLIQDGKAAIANIRDIAGFRIRLPLVDIHTVGAGGGSIAHIGRDGLMKVGPESAGAIPGPACYGMGGTEPTVSDANVFLGRLPTSLAGGGLMIDPQKAAVAIEKIAADLDIEPVRAALGIAGIVTSNMTRAIRAVSVERGHDPRQFTLMPFGGAGGLHAADVARSLDMKRVLIPHAPGILCADGLLDSDLQENFVLTCRSPLTDALPQIQAVAEAGFTMAEKWLEQEAADAGPGRIFLSLDMRYIGQNYELPVQIFAGSDMLEIGDIEAMKAQFLAAHQRSYGHADPQAAIEIVNVRVKVVAALSQTVIDFQAPQGTVASVTSSHVWFSAAEPHITPVYQR
ncbi:MAG: hydantoinase/oxoprolinase family protein, partial [Rhodobacterales bacterium]